MSKTTHPKISKNNQERKRANGQSQKQLRQFSRQQTQAYSLGAPPHKKSKKALFKGCPQPINSHRGDGVRDRF